VQRPKRRASKPKPLPFTEEQISARAYEIWERRGQQGTPEENWQAAIAALKQERSPLWKLRRTWQSATHTDNRNFTLDVVKVIISAFGVLATIFAGVGLYLTYQNSQAERQINTDRLVTDRFAKAVEQLGSQDIHVRLGGIYSLERIAKDSPKDHWTVMEVLTAYVRNKSPLPKGWLETPIGQRKPLPSVTTDVQSALTVIGRREVKNDPEGKALDLSRSNLSGADLRGAKLDGANLNSAYIARADLLLAHLNSAHLSIADLTGANLIGADLRGTDLLLAKLDGAHLSIADLRGAFLGGADLGGADLGGARGIPPEQIKQAKDWQKAHYDDDFRKQLGLPPEKS